MDFNEFDKEEKQHIDSIAKVSTPTRTESLGIDQLADALSKAQGTFPAPAKNRLVDFQDKNGKRVHYKYADLADVIECIRKPLSDNGLSFTHTFEYCHAEGGFGLRTWLLHSSGQKLTSFYPLPHPSAVKPQEFGSALTYARRYSVSALAGIASEEDDDGATAQAPQKPKPEPRKTNAPAASGVSNGFSEASTHAAPKIAPVANAAAIPSELSDAQLKRLFTIAKSAQWTNEQVKEYIGYRWSFESTKQLTREQYDMLINVISTRGFFVAKEDAKSLVAPPAKTFTDDVPF